MLPNVNDFVTSQYGNRDPFFGRIAVDAYIAKNEGECGDDMSFYLLIEDDIIVDAKYYTEKGCGHTRSAGRILAQLVKGQDIYTALKINPVDLLEAEPKLNASKHCSILAITTFYNAVASYLIDQD
jgi:NifU-like protein involved in Fe-S cluster formation